MCFYMVLREFLAVPTPGVWGLGSISRLPQPSKVSKHSKAQQIKHAIRTGAQAICLKKQKAVLLARLAKIAGGALLVSLLSSSLNQWISCQLGNEGAQDLLTVHSII